MFLERITFAIVDLTEDTNILHRTPTNISCLQQRAAMDSSKGSKNQKHREKHLYSKLYLQDHDFLIERSKALIAHYRVPSILTSSLVLFLFLPPLSAAYVPPLEESSLVDAS